MCTVSYIRTENEKILTANRDEQTSRPPALPPREFRLHQKTIVYPKDPLSGGSWFIADDDGNCAILLNGAETKHLATPPYRKSRGLILKGIMDGVSPISCWDVINLHNIEPFTIILLQGATLHKLCWDGLEKIQHMPDPDRHHIWSSATLYDQEIRKRRVQWFSDFRLGKETINGDDILYFHRTAQKEDRENGLMISRGNLLKTLSITQARFTDSMVQFYYFQVSPEETHLRSMPLK